MAKIMKRAQTGKNVPKGMVESEMSPGKMIPKSKSNYLDGKYAKMLGVKPSAPKAKVKPKAQLGGLLKGIVKSGVKTAEKSAVRSKGIKGISEADMIRAFDEMERKRMKAHFKELDAKEAAKNTGSKMKAGGMLKRADGSYSKRGLWDNIRANRGSGKKPTAAMLKQERKIKAKSKK
jgi:hypothetical protein